ncbi:MAG TPA: hypothetical protein VFF69_05555 [Phycisphaerales bacterium]|nr:hypothetical protein [Phycisphaerales bacterium]
MTDANHLNNDIYTDTFGTSVSFQQAPSEGAVIRVIPAPATLAPFLLAPLVRRAREDQP